jgi:hypothetical protein
MGFSDFEQPHDHRNRVITGKTSPAASAVTRLEILVSPVDKAIKLDAKTWAPFLELQISHTGSKQAFSLLLMHVSMRISDLLRASDLW